MSSTSVSGSIDEPVPPQRKRINAKRFVEAFLEKPVDLHLMALFSISPKQLDQIYAALVEKGLLSDFEVSQREKSAPEPKNDGQFQLSASATVRLVEEPSEVLTERITQSGYIFDSGLSEAISQALDDKRWREGRRRGPEKYEKKIDRCPRCGKPKDPSSPEECVFCGVVFKKT